MHGVHYGRSSALGQIVQLANHGLVLELALVVRGRIKLSALGQIVQLDNHGLVLELSLVVRVIIKAMMKNYLRTHGNRLWNGPRTKTYILDYLLSKRWMYELV